MIRMNDSILAIEERSALSFAMRLLQPMVAKPPAKIESKIADGVAVFPITGILTDTGDYFGYGTEETSLRAVEKTARELTHDPQVAAVMLAIDSPGGILSQAQLDAHGAIIEMAKAKPTYVHTTDILASAAFWLASGAEKIFATKVATVGSVGVRTNFYDWSRFFQNMGISPVAIDSGKLKSTGMWGTALSEEGRQMFQALIDNAFAEFKAAVMAGRKMTAEDFEKISAGGVFSAPDALNHKLIDGIQSSAETLSALRQQASKKGYAAKVSADVPTQPTQEISTMDTPPTQTAPTTTQPANPTPVAQPVAPVAQPTQPAAPAPVAQPAAPAAEKAATLAELKAAFPESTAQWREECQEAGATMGQAKDKWIEALSKQVREANSRTNVGAQVTTSTSRGDVAASCAPGGAIGDFNALVEQKINTLKVSADEAMRMAKAERPDLYKQYRSGSAAAVAAANWVNPD